MKAFHWLIEDRVDYVSTSHSKAKLLTKFLWFSHNFISFLLIDF